MTLCRVHFRASAKSDVGNALNLACLRSLYLFAAVFRDEPAGASRTRDVIRAGRSRARAHRLTTEMLFKFSTVRCPWRRRASSRIEVCRGRSLGPTPPMHSSQL